MDSFITPKERLYEKELWAAFGYVGTREEFEEIGLTFAGTYAMAKKCGYYTINGYRHRNEPLTKEEIENVTHFCMLADCYPNQCIPMADGTWKRPCIPVFLRE